VYDLVVDVAIGDRVALVTDEPNMKAITVLTVTALTSNRIVAGSLTFHRHTGKPVGYASRKLTAPVPNQYLTGLHSPIVHRILAMQALNRVVATAYARRIVRVVPVFDADVRLRAIEAEVRQARHVIDALMDHR
jgi:hypothetical protein